MIGKIAQILINLIGVLGALFGVIIVSGMYVSNSISKKGLYEFGLEVFIFSIVLFGLISMGNYYFFKKRKKKKPLFRAMIILLISLVIVSVWFLFNIPPITNI